MSKPKVFIGVGHGGKDPGAVGCNGTEKEMALWVATECKRVLNGNGVRAKRSRKSNHIEDPVTDEVKECNEYNPDLTVELHFNASTLHQGYGWEAYYVSEKGKEIGEFIVKEINEYTDLNVRGLKKYGFYYLTKTKCPALLIESAFVDNTKDKFWCTKEGCEYLGRLYAGAIINYFKNKGVI